MVTSEKIFGLDYYKFGGVFTGGYVGKTRYRIERIKEQTEGEDAGEEVYFLASVWDGGNAYQVTPKEEIRQKHFPFDEEGKSKMIDWLNQEIKS